MTNDDIISWQLAGFPIQGPIEIGGRLGLMRLQRTEDDRLILVGSADYGTIDHDKPAPADFSRPDSILGFVLDIGIRRERQLTYGNGFYFGVSLIAPDSKKPVSQDNFDGQLCDRIASLIRTNYQSGDKQKETDAIRLQLLFDTYNDALLLYRQFPSESYLALMRIIDALSPHSHGGAGGFAAFAGVVSPQLNRDFHERLKAGGSLASRSQTAVSVFDSVMTEATKSKWACRDHMAQLDQAGKIVFACFYSAYQYRNSFVHQGFPFPQTVKEAFGLESDSVTAYLSPSLGISWTKVYRPDGLQKEDSIDIHDILPKKVENFQNEYFHLLPTWYFAKRVAREALLSRISE